MNNEHAKLGPYIIFESGGKQYAAQQGETVAVEKIEGETGATIILDHVLLRRRSESEVDIGQPYLKDTAKASIVKQTKDAKLVVFRFKRRQKVRRKQGHRQQKTIIRIESF